LKIRAVSRWAVAAALLLIAYGAAGPFALRARAASAPGPAIAAVGVARRQTVPAAAFPGRRPGFALRSLSRPSAPASPRVVPILRGPAPPEFPSATPMSPPGAPAGGAPRALPKTLELRPPALLAPSLLSSFGGLADDLTVVPPDTMGAAGDNTLVSFLNSEVGFFDKSGTRLNPGVSLRDFWLPLIGDNGLPDNADVPTVFDPKVLYDAGSGRFVAVTLDGILPKDNSWILFAISRSSDPMGGWYTWAIAADPTGATWADYPGLGVDDNNVYITANRFSAGDLFQTSRILRIPKAQLLVSTQAADLEWTEFTSSRFNLQPAHTFGGASPEYLITEANTSIGGRRFLDVYAIAGTPPALVLHGSVEVARYPVVTSLPVAPQTGIDTGDTRILNAVVRNGHLYATHTVSDNAVARTEVAWYEIALAPLSLVQQGRVSDPSRFYYYPSIAVNRNGDIAIGFSGSSPTEFPGAYYTARLSSDAAGFTEPVGVLRAGDGPYSKALTGTDSRWGDFSATMVDPSDDFTFWTLQEYAQVPSSAPGAVNPGRWGTWWGSFRLAPIGAPADLVATAIGLFEVRLSWVSQSTNETGFRVERKTGASGTYEVITSPPLPPGTTSYTDNTVLSGTTYFYRVQSFNATDNAFSSEAFVTTPSPSSGGGGGCTAAPPGRSAGGGDVAAALAASAVLAGLAARRRRRRPVRPRASGHRPC
jgi:hypothetical protein